MLSAFSKGIYFGYLSQELQTSELLDCVKWRKVLEYNTALEDGRRVQPDDSVQW